MCLPVALGLGQSQVPVDQPQGAGRCQHFRHLGASIFLGAIAQAGLVVTAKGPTRKHQVAVTARGHMVVQLKHARGQVEVFGQQARLVIKA